MRRFWLPELIGRASTSPRSNARRLPPKDETSVGGKPPRTPGLTDVVEGFAPVTIDVALVGGIHPNPTALAAAGATWAAPELMPGTSAAQVRAAAGWRPVPPAARPDVSV